MIDTRLRGNPDDLRSAGSYLADVLSGGISDLADSVAGQRLTLQRGWEGEGGSAFAERTAILSRAGDDACGAVRSMGQQLEALAATLEVVQLGMGAVRAEAAAAGLTVRGPAILLPPYGPFAQGSPELASAQQLAAAYEAARIRRDELVRQWTEALTQTSDFVEANATVLAQVTIDLLVAGYSGALLARQSSVMAAQAAHKLAESQRLRALAAELLDAVRHGRVAPYASFYDDVDDLMGRSRQAAEEAAEAAAAAKHPKLPSGIVRGLGVLGPIAAGYGVYDDMRNGESTEQAVASQGGGLLAGMATGGATGAVIGTMGFPVVGTVVGGVVGAGTSVVVSSVIDDHYEDEAAEQAEQDLQDRQDDEQHLHNLLNASEGIPFYATPGSSAPPVEQWR
ncbi:MAG: WXG100 family type VII secretion target [Nocardioides sp.]|nr:WXG100 family type VII secretion target [Nocardioides sp.]